MESYHGRHWWPLALKIVRATSQFHSIWDIELIDMRHGFQNDSDMGQGYFLDSTCDMGINKRQGHAALAFLKIDRRHGGPPSRAPPWSYRHARARARVSRPTPTARARQMAAKYNPRLKLTIASSCGHTIV